ncbi:ATP phosphoribosyltransferase [Methanococcus maripaludis]|uniref:ATP phosphoribosyltransferase n=1 Tax=Methanococcus maripaludis TaxID=39152 RepID=A0A7J9S1U8_METMI|nr:ATP phosphoribosyltransferase [Methanococcus maripaludis]MBA2840276.1 ATP phosphoribosyltransferase [Methanococcus maripaludis]MBA2852883.1 ATP phosphoribosyltransferase [Methanococcus maripaludis]MBA2859988.1 ATP phosphoribosyltransferase [Methanococcus maripaludis]MBA2868629.1 ATP phosphoribosyltransferase [Methanococcus maripaludis]MBB6400767.1 ATP phosphoribosyltransferase [Methanococcus maripaludis]
MILLALPNKGRISKPVNEILEKSGLKISVHGRSLFANTVDPEIKVMFARAKDIPEFVRDGVADVGVTGYDLMLERDTEEELEMLLDFKFGNARLVLAAPENSGVNSLDDVKDGMKIATEFPGLTKRYLEKKGLNLEIIELSGATEIAPFIGVSDLICDLTSTGTTLQLNRLKEIENVVSSTTRLVANKKSMKDPEKSAKINQVLSGIKSVMYAQSKRLIMMNAPKDKVSEITSVIPGMGGPTVSEILSNCDMLAINAVIDENKVFETVSNLEKLGARDILVVPIERIL